MNALAQQLPALIGVTVGTLGTIFATGIADRTRWRRQHSVRWDDKRLDAYIEHARIVKEMHTLALDSVDWRGTGETPRTTRVEATTRIQQLNVQRATTWERVLLLGDAEAVAAARVWREAVTDIVLIASKPERVSTEILPAIQHANEARDKFYEAARKNLGLQAGSVAQSDWLNRSIRPIGS